MLHTIRFGHQLPNGETAFEDELRQLNFDTEEQAHAFGRTQCEKSYQQTRTYFVISYYKDHRHVRTPRP